VFFEHTALRLRERGVEISWILINSEGNDIDFFLKKNNFKIAYLKASSIRKGAQDYFELEKGVASYFEIYKNIF